MVAASLHDAMLHCKHDRAAVNRWCDGDWQRISRCFLLKPVFVMGRRTTAMPRSVALPAYVFIVNRRFRLFTDSSA
ncbi:hypothetical protein CSC70_06810 [Pseudoxanthomonas kalamensis DSM 18571]|nr:hypothetical protein CSC70_06810 [Pseudoxanthomonas kalamensis DSM 18571]